jgi:hypothetical protein
MKLREDDGRLYFVDDEAGSQAAAESLGADD